MDRARAWVLNLGAEDELARLDAGGATPSLASYSRAKLLAETLVRVGLVPAGDLVLDAREPAPIDVPWSHDGRAWSPTPQALRVLARARVTPPEAPTVAVLRGVTARSFACGLDVFREHAPPSTRLCADLAALDAALSDPGAQYVLKRPYSYAGRGRLQLAPSERADPRVADWIASSLREGPLLCEPWVTRTADYALHGHLARDGRLTLGEPTRQWVTARGAWERTERCPADEITGGEYARLVDAARACASALTRENYFGPFGVDAFRWTTAAGATRFRALCELNARYTMGWAVGMGSRRPDLGR